MENTKYCIFCGAENTADADTCAVCGKTMHPREDLLKEYLYRKTKAKLRGKAEDSFLSVLKNWILSHLYGLVVTISLVTLAFTMAGSFSSRPSYVRRISSPERPVYLADGTNGESTGQTGNSTPAPSPAGDGELAVTEDDEDTVLMLINEYNLRYVEADAAAHGGWMESDDDHGHERNSMEDCLVPASSGYSGANEYYKLDPLTFMYDEVFTEMGEPLVNAPTTELGNRILSDGHPVIECTVTNRYSGAGGSRELTFKYVSTRLDGIWYIAEILSM